MPADPLELAAIEMVRVRLPMRRSRAAAHGTMPAERDVVLVRALGSDGAEGWGECSALEAPTYGDEHTDGAWAVLRDIVVPTALAGGRNRGIGHPMASASVDVAVTDLSLRRQGLTLPGALGRDDAEGLALAWTGVVGMQSSIDDVLAEVDEAVDRGAAAVKLKICPGWDVEPVTAVHDAHPQLRISVDANGSFGREHTEHLVELGRLLAECGGYLEQPLAAEDLSGLTRLASRSRARVALDETVVSATDAGILGSLRDRGLINVKPARLGGVSSTLALAQVVASIKAKRRPQTFLGGMFETGVGRSAVLAIGQVSVTLAETDLGPSVWYFEEDVTDPVELGADGLHRATSWPGLSLAPRPERLAEVAVDRLTRAVSAPVRLEAHASGHWQVERWWGSAVGLHGLDWPEPLSPTVWLMEVDHPTLVLGSTQRPDAVDADALGRAGIDVVVRRSGGGAVLVEPDGSVWIDVLIPRNDRLWDDDVNRSFGWLGESWRQALADLGLDATVHDGPLVCGAFGRQVCFAAVGSGEVTVAGAKAVGLSQRRTRAGARLQATCYRRWRPEPLAALGLDPALLPPVATVDQPAPRIEAALLAHLP